MADKNTLTISEAAHLLGVTNKTLRLWDKSGKLKAKRDQNNYRVYDKKQVAKIARETQNKHFRITRRDRDDIESLISGYDLRIVQAFEADYVKQLKLDYFEVQDKPLDNLIVALACYEYLRDAKELTSAVSYMTITSTNSNKYVLNKILKTINNLGGVQDALIEAEQYVKNYNYQSNIEQLVFGNILDYLDLARKAFESRPELIKHFNKYLESVTL